MVVADVHALPFRDGAFDFAICSHVLEHVDDPVRAAAELSRTSAAGYVETPSELHEKLMPMGWHKWLVRRDGTALVFDAKPSPFLDDRLGGYFGRLWMADRAWMRFVWSHVDDLFVRHYWRGHLVVETTGPAPRFADDDPASPGGQQPCDEAPTSRRRRAVSRVISGFRYGRGR